jgi:hypothetical protein
MPGKGTGVDSMGIAIQAAGLGVRRLLRREVMVIEELIEESIEKDLLYQEICRKERWLGITIWKRVTTGVAVPLFT